MNFEALTSGFYFEGLFVTEDAIWFSDVTQEGIRRLLPDGRIQQWPGKRLIGGIIVNDDGVVLSSGAGGISWLDPVSGASGLLIETIDGTPIEGVNEMAADSSGALYFGTIDHPAIERGDTPGPSALYRLTPDGRCVKVADDLTFSNAFALSSDGRRLYHNETFVGTFSFDVAADGSLGAPTMLLEKPDCDGMALDCEGGIWITGFESNELIRMLPDGNIERRINLPAKASATNVFFAGEDGRDLYVTAVRPEAADELKHGRLPSGPTSFLFRGRSEISGLPVRRPRFRVR
ncbi:MAG: SMP-30/gluconolactonase/LRE family protein [Steroidobacteraceae bacterium]